jgi:hypothetical protein
VTVQDAVVALLAALALGWLVWRRVRQRRKGATACAHCPAGTPVEGVRPPPQPEVLLAIGEPPPPGERERDRALPGGGR